jgi:hypothetical protein
MTETTTFRSPCKKTLTKAQCLSVIKKMPEPKWSVFSERNGLGSMGWDSLYSYDGRPQFLLRTSSYGPAQCFDLRT